MKTLITLLKSKTTWLALVVALATWNCGGGGGGSSTPATTYTYTCPADSSVQTSTVSQADAQSRCSNIVATVATPTYSNTSEEYTAFNLLNAERSRCGFGKLAQNTTLDLAAQKHADYLLLNNSFTHTETNGSAGFYGINAWDRWSAAGYAWSTGSEGYTGFTGTSSMTGNGNYTIRTLLAIPYHSAEMLRNYRDVGIAIRNNTLAGAVSSGTRQVLEYAYTTAQGDQHQNGTATLIYPCSGTTGVYTSNTGEAPTPVPGRNLATSPLGHAITIKAYPGNTLAITSATLVTTVGGVAVTLRTPITQANDPYGTTYLGTHEGYILPDAPLATNTSYTATVNGTSNGVPFTLTSVFTTGGI